MDAFRTGEVAQSVLAEIAQLHPWGQRPVEQRRRGLRDEDLPAVAECHQTGGAVERRAEVVAVARFGVARVHAHPHAQRAGGAPLPLAERELAVHRRAERGTGRREHREDAVAGRLDHMTARGFHRLPH